MIIAIDGPSGTGKSTVARAVAKKLGISFFDTGAMYRSVAWLVLKRGIDPSDQEAVSALMKDFHVDIETDAHQERKYWIRGEEITKAIREPRIAPVASQVAAYPEVRAALVSIQRKFGHQRSAVFEGRDMGTVVFPHADVKIFLTASPEVRASRRYEEWLVKFPDLAKALSKEEILKEINARDEYDSSRTISPLKQASDALKIDTSYLNISQVVKKVIKQVNAAKKGQTKMKFAYWLVYSLARTFFKIFFRLKIFGLKHFRKGPGIIASNHASLYDPPVLSISCPEEVHFLAKGSLFRIPLLGRLIRVLNTHPLQKGASDVQTFRLIIQILQEGHKVILFPEGSRSLDGNIQPLKRGLSFLIMKAKVPIFPAYLEGTFDAWPIKKKFPRLFGKMRCVFGSPIYFEDFEGLSKQEMDEAILKKTEASIHSLKKWLEEGAVGDPP